MYEYIYDVKLIFIILWSFIISYLHYKYLSVTKLDDGIDHSHVCKEKKNVAQGRELTSLS